MFSLSTEPFDIKCDLPFLEVLEEEDSKDKDMINVLEDDFHTLASSKIKDRLSAFLPDIPGNIDVTDNVESLSLIHI